MFFFIHNIFTVKYLWLHLKTSVIIFHFNSYQYNFYCIFAKPNRTECVREWGTIFSSVYKLLLLIIIINDLDNTNHFFFEGCNITANETELNVVLKNHLQPIFLLGFTESQSVIKYFIIPLWKYSTLFKQIVFVRY